MRLHPFLTAVRRQLVLDDRHGAARVTRAVVTTLGERIDAEAARAVARPLPMELRVWLARADSGQSFGPREFRLRVARRAGTRPADAEYHAMVVLELLADEAPAAVSRLDAATPPTFADLFRLADARGDSENRSPPSGRA